MNGKLGKTKEIKETVGKMRKLQEGNCGKTWKNRRNARKGLEKRHEMEAMQSFEKARNIETSISKKLTIRSSTESSVRWGSEQDGLQGDEE